jgi:hypothetical protein
LHSVHASKAAGTGEGNYEFGLTKYLSSYFILPSEGRRAADFYRSNKAVALGKE